MQRIDGDAVVVAQPTPVAESAPGYFGRGNPALNQKSTQVTADWLNQVQEELLAAIVAAGLTPSKTDNDQLLEAILLLASGAPAAVTQTMTTSAAVSSGVTVVFIDCTSGSVTATLPAASSKRKILFIRIDSTANTATVQRAGSDTILGANSVEIDGYGSKLELIPTGTTWFQC